MDGESETRTGCAREVALGHRSPARGYPRVVAAERFVALHADSRAARLLAVFLARASISERKKKSPTRAAAATTATADGGGRGKKRRVAAARGGGNRDRVSKGNRGLTAQRDVRLCDPPRSFVPVEKPGEYGGLYAADTVRVSRRLF